MQSITFQFQFIHSQHLCTCCWVLQGYTRYWNWTGVQRTVSSAARHTGTPRLAHWGIPRQINRALTGGQQRQHGPPPSVSSRLAGALRSSIYYATPSFPLRSHRTATPVFKSPASGSPPCSGTTSPCFHFRWEYTVGMASVVMSAGMSI